MDIDQKKLEYGKNENILSIPFKQPDYIPVNVKDVLLHLQIIKNMKDEKGEK